MTRIVIAPSSVRAGAKGCALVAREASAAAQRVQGLPEPEGAPGGAMAMARSTAAQLRHSAGAASSEAAFLRARAGKAHMLDGPFGTELDLTLPELRSPWALPAPALEHKEPCGLKGFMKGMGLGLADTAKTMATTTAAIGGHTLDGDTGALGPVTALAHRYGLPRLSDHVPLMGSARKQIDSAMKYAARHPRTFARAMADSTVAGPKAHRALRRHLVVKVPSDQALGSAPSVASRDDERRP